MPKFSFVISTKLLVGLPVVGPSNKTKGLLFLDRGSNIEPLFGACCAWCWSIKNVVSSRAWHRNIENMRVYIDLLNSDGGSSKASLWIFSALHGYIWHRGLKNAAEASISTAHNRIMNCLLHYFQAIYPSCLLCFPHVSCLVCYMLYAKSTLWLVKPLEHHRNNCLKCVCIR